MFVSMTRVSNISDRDFNAIRTMIYQEAGISLSDAKRALVCSRLAKRLRHLNLRNHAEYLDYLATRDAEGAERQVMINCLTTNKTDFFREPHHFAFLREQRFSSASNARPSRGGPSRLRIWSAACSTGEEPYSIAITILEHFGSLRGWDVQVLASDINTEVLQKAGEGIYALDRIDGLEDRISRKYFSARHRTPVPASARCALKSGVSSASARSISWTQRWPLKTRFDVDFLPERAHLLRRADPGAIVAPAGRAIDRQRLPDARPLGKPALVDRACSHRWAIPCTSAARAICLPSLATTLEPIRHAPANGCRARSGIAGCGTAARSRRGRREIIAGEFFAARQPTVISTILGSCVAACLFDPADPHRRH